MNYPPTTIWLVERAVREWILAATSDEHGENLKALSAETGTLEGRRR